MTRLEKELLEAIRQRVEAVLPTLRRLAQAYAALGAAAKATLTRLLPELAELLRQLGEAA